MTIRYLATNAADCHAYAAELRKKAMTVRSDTHRLFLLRLAERWDLLAAENDAIVDRPRPAGQTAG